MAADDFDDIITILRDFSNPEINNDEIILKIAHSFKFT